MLARAAGNGRTRWVGACTHLDSVHMRPLEAAYAPARRGICARSRRPFIPAAVGVDIGCGMTRMQYLNVEGD
jgi:hypothetical protein